MIRFLPSRTWSKAVSEQLPPTQCRRIPAASLPSTRSFSTYHAYHSIHDDYSKSQSNLSVDPSEVHHFNALASTWWDPHGPSRLLHLMNPLRHDFITYCRSTSFDNGHARDQKLRYLDVGCGGGIFAESAARLPLTASVTAIDPSAEVLAVARAHARRDPLLHKQQERSAQAVDKENTDALRRLTYLNSTVEDLPTPQRDDDRADIVTAFEVIEHVPRPASFLNAVTSHVKPGGWLVLSTIARTWASYLTTKVVAESLLRVVPRGTHDWYKYINRDELANWFSHKEEWATPVAMGVLYVPGLGWKFVPNSERLGNYFFGIQKNSIRESG